jgi:hypothetical protein
MAVEDVWAEVAGSAIGKAVVGCFSPSGRLTISPISTADNAVADDQSFHQPCVAFL